MIVNPGFGFDQAEVNVQAVGEWRSQRPSRMLS